MYSFLYCFPYRYSCRHFTLLKALAKSNGNHFAIASKSDNFRESNLEKKQRTDTINEKKN